MNKQKIVVLGGGVGAMTAVFHLTNPPDWQDRYDITVYQMGWRLGGKGASGRGAHGRIEEHGLHMWYGFYENAFKLIQDVYAAADRPRGAPLSTWEEAFKPQSFTVYEECIGGRWVHWPITLGTNDGTPGVGGEFPTVAELIAMLLREMLNMLLQAQQPDGPPPPDSLPPQVQQSSWWQQLMQGAEHTLEHTVHRVGILLLNGALALVEHMAQSGMFGKGELLLALEHFAGWLNSLLDGDLDRDATTRRLFILLDLVGTILRGLETDDVRDKGLASLNDIDFMAWLRKHGVNETYTLPFVNRNLYDQAFAYENGDKNRPNFAAGVVVYTAMRTYFTYKGAFLWKMQAGMGDTIFGPIYEVLKQRGVTFRFFHKVESLHVSGNRISGITLQQQATVKTGPDTYAPFVTVKGLPCWPSRPDYAQLVEGDALQQQRINLESHWTPWQGVGTCELVAGQDFDLVLFGISVGSVPYVCSELVAARPEWQAMIQYVQTTQTQAVQLWLRPDDAGLGWPMWREPAATLTGYDAISDPQRAGLDTWGDFSHLIPREEWPSDAFPNHIAYFCGAMRSVDGLKLPPAEDTHFPAQQQAQVEDNGRDFLDHHISHLWPRATRADNPDALNWDLVVGQFYRANIDPSERYVLSVAGSVQHRLPPGRSGFDNLVLAGDWTYNGLLSLGCVESAVWGGMQAANAILPQFGYTPVEIIGWAE